jgi:hypothetical protein
MGTNTDSKLELPNVHETALVICEENVITRAIDHSLS